MNWIILIIAGFCETGFAFCLGKGNLATGSKAALWYTAFAALCILSMVLLTKATKTIPLGTAYPVWTGIGAVGTVLIGILRSCLNFISRLFESSFRVNFHLGYAGNSGLFPIITNEKLPKRASKKPKLSFAATNKLFQ